MKIENKHAEASEIYYSDRTIFHRILLRIPGRGMEGKSLSFEWNGDFQVFLWLSKCRHVQLSVDVSRCKYHVQQSKVQHKLAAFRGAEI